MSKNMDSVYDLEQAAKDVFKKLSSGDTSVDLGQAQLRALNSMAHYIGIRVEHARLSGRIAQGSDVLPDLKTNPHAQATITATPTQKRAKVVKAKAA